MANTSSRTLRLLSLLQTHRFWPGAELTERLAPHGMVVQEMKGLGRAADGTRSLIDDTTVTYIGWALRTR